MRRRIVLAVGATLGVALPRLAADLARPVALALSHDQSRIFVVHHDADTLACISADTGAELCRAATAAGPTEVAEVAARGEIWVVARFSDAIGRFSVDTLTPIGAIPVPRGCERLVIDAVNSRAYVSNRAHNQVLRIETVTLAVDALALPGRAPQDLLLDSAQGRLFAAQFHSESLAVIDLASFSVIAIVPVGATPMGLSLSAEGVVVGHLGLAGSTADDAIANRVSVIDRATLSVRSEFPLPLATPIASASNPASFTAWLACFGADRAVEVDLRNGAILRNVVTGPNPTALARRNDGRLFVLNQLGDSITVVEDGSLLATWPLNPAYPGIATPELRGERLFNYSSQTANTCYSCHPGGGLDGLSRFIAPPNYLGSQTINTPSLRAIRWTPPYLRIGSVPSVGLHVANIFAAVQGHPVTGEQLSDLVAYLNALRPAPNPFAKTDGQLNALELQGKAVFEHMNCASCHEPALYTSRRAYNVGTGGVADTPSLLGLHDSAPFLHDGRAASLANVFAPLPGRHTPPIVFEADRAALAAYLVTLPNPQVFWRPPAHALAGGLTRADINIQVFDATTGRPTAGANVQIEEVSGASVVIEQPMPTDERGETRGSLRAGLATTAQIRLRLEGAVATELRTIEFTAPAQALVNVAAAAGVDFVMPPLAYPRAVAIADYDGDGAQDLFVAVSGKNSDGIHVGAPSVLMRNRGDGTFEDVTQAAGLYRSNRSSAGAAWGDYDNDGDPDLYVNNRGALGSDAARSELFRNNGDGTFTEVAQVAGVADGGFGYSVFWIDFDRDGRLDLFVENLAVGGNEGNLTPDHVYRNNGDGTFADVTAQADAAGWSASGGDGGAVGDYGGDGWQDIVKVSIDEPISRFFLLHNQHDGTFALDGCPSPPGNCAEHESRGAALGDYDNDGDLDLFIVGRGLFRNDLNVSGSFSDVTEQIGFPFAPFAGRRFGHTFADLDNDGWLDIVAENRTDKLAVFLNQQGNGFEVLDDVEIVLDAASDPKVGLGTLDFDLDGDLDVFLGREGDGSTGQPQALFENRINGENHFLRVTLVGSHPLTPRAAQGARISVATAGGPTQMREIASGENAAGCADTMQHFGLGPARQAETLRVRWPSGLESDFSNLPANQHVRIVEGQSIWTPLRTWYDVDAFADRVTGRSPLHVNFTSALLHGSPPCVYLWDFDDDGAFGSGPAVEHTFVNAGPTAREHEVRLDVRDAENRLAHASVRITVLPGWPGDVDGDGDVDLIDLTRLLSSFGLCSGAPAFDEAADLDGGGCVALPDLALLLANFGS